MHSIYRTLKTALHALRRNVMRSVLTCLGIIIGVAAVIAMIEIGQGSSVAIQSSISKLGANIVMVFPGEAQQGGVSFGTGSRITLTPEDCEAIIDECPAVRNASPSVGSRLQLVYGHKNWQPNQINGTTLADLDVSNWTVAQGEFFTDHDVQAVNNVCVIGATVVRELFEGENPVGKQIRVKNTHLKVVGVLQAKGASMMGWDQDDILMAPWTTVKYRLSNQMLSNVNQSAAVASSGSSLTTVNTLNNLYPSSGSSLYPAPSTIQQADTPQPVRFHNIDRISVSVRSPGEIPAAIRQITDLLRQRHHIRASQPDDFNIRDMTEFTKAFASTSQLMTTLLLCVAAISLMVGGVGIMNIMLVSVTERTREIGLRMAVGARGRDILRQFLVEAVMLCLAGGAAGIMFGRGGSVLVRWFLRWPIAVSIPAIIIAVGVSALIGICFGFYPAWKASRLDPIEALRYE
jgi:ABC-type antimicrobial peptide transport system permease subunit